MKSFLSVCFFLFAICTYAQVKIGDNINTIDANSILELESSSKALVITRLSDTEMNALTPLNGAMVYNMDVKCIFVFEGTVWKSLCNSEIMVLTAAIPPTTMGIGDIWVNETNNKVYLWDGTAWIPITKNPSSGNGAPTPATVTDPVAGDIYVDTNSGDIYTYNGVDWVDQTINVTNGLSETTNNTLELGGNLTKATEIGTTDTNTLAVTGLEVVTDTVNMVVTVDTATGVLRRTPMTSLTQKEEIVVIANNGQNQFNTPLTITDPVKIDVYRNGVKIDFTAVGTNTIELETDVICYQNDEIRIVQFF